MQVHHLRKLIHLCQFLDRKMAGGWKKRNGRGRNLFANNKQNPKKYCLCIHPRYHLHFYVIVMHFIDKGWLMLFNIIYQESCVLVSFSNGNFYWFWSLGIGHLGLKFRDMGGDRWGQISCTPEMIINDSMITEEKKQLSVIVLDYYRITYFSHIKNYCI